MRRDGKLIHAVGSEFVLAANDILYLSGRASSGAGLPTLQAAAHHL